LLYKLVHTDIFNCLTKILQVNIIIQRSEALFLTSDRSLHFLINQLNYIMLIKTSGHFGKLLGLIKTPNIIGLLSDFLKFIFAFINKAFVKSC
jgi:hypothetical protein